MRTALDGNWCCILFQTTFIANSQTVYPSKAIWQDKIRYTQVEIRDYAKGKDFFLNDKHLLDIYLRIRAIFSNKIFVWVKKLKAKLMLRWCFQKFLWVLRTFYVFCLGASEVDPIMQPWSWKYWNCLLSIKSDVVVNPRAKSIWECEAWCSSKLICFSCTRKDFG